MPTNNHLPDTSHEANRLMTKELRSDDHDKIIEALTVLGEGNFTDIASYLFWSDKNKVSRRLAELERDSKIYKTGGTKLTPTGRKSNIYKAVIEGQPIPKAPEPEHYMQGKTSAADYASKLIAATKEGRLQQNTLFTTED